MGWQHTKREPYKVPCQYCGNIEIRTDVAIKAGRNKATCFDCKTLFRRENVLRRTHNEKYLKRNQENYKKLSQIEKGLLARGNARNL